MRKLSWAEENLPQLGRKFLSDVLDNMRDHQETTVQFGETGNGVYPNYQIIFPNGRKWEVRGRNDETFSNADDFDEKRISKPFLLHQVQAAYEKY